MRPHKVVFERVASHYPQERKRSTKIKPYFVPSRPKHTGKNIEHPLVCAYKTTLTRPATATVYRARYLKRFELHNLGKPSYGSDSPPSRSEQNFKEWTIQTRNTFNHRQQQDVHQQQDASLHRRSMQRRPETPDIYASRSYRNKRPPLVLKRPQTSHERTKKKSCYRSFHFAGSTVQQESPSFPQKVTWSMPKRKEKKGLGKTVARDFPETEDHTHNNSVRATNTKESNKKHLAPTKRKTTHTTETTNHATLKNSAQNTPATTRKKPTTHSIDSWIFFVRKIPVTYDTVLCTESDVRHLIESCDPSVVILAVHVGRNLTNRFAHVKIKGDTTHNVKQLVLKHRNALGRGYGRWDHVKACVATAHQNSSSESSFGFYCSKKQTGKDGEEAVESYSSGKSHQRGQRGRRNK